MRNISDYADCYSLNGFEQYQVEYRRKKVIEVLERYNPDSILEIGCGLDPTFFHWGSGKKWIIYEPADVFYRKALELSSGQENITVVKDFFPPDIWSFGRVDMVLCSSLLHEVEKPDVLLDGIRKVCDDGTMVHINVPNANSVHRILAKESGYIKSVYGMSNRNITLQQNRVYDLDLLIEEVECAGFEVIDKGSFFVKFFSHSQMWTMLEKGIIDKHVLDGMYKLSEYMPDLGSEIFVNIRLNNEDKLSK